MCERMPKLQALLKLALITGARIGELLALPGEDCPEKMLLDAIAQCVR